MPLLVLLSLLQRDRTRQLDRAIALATHDPLTASRTARSSTSGSTSSSPSERSIAVLLIDLDRFKEVNDTLGHALGDELLVEVGRRLRPLLPAPDLIARLGGDEFAVFMEAADDGRTRCSASTSSSTRSASRSTSPGSTSTSTRASASRWPTMPSLTAADLLRRADVAMYTAKEDRAGRALYSSDRDHYSAERLALAGRLRRGIADGELELHYQPQVDLATARSSVSRRCSAGTTPAAGWSRPTSSFPSPSAPS